MKWWYLRLYKDGQWGPYVVSNKKSRTGWSTVERQEDAKGWSDESMAYHFRDQWFRISMIGTGIREEADLTPTERACISDSESED